MDPVKAKANFSRLCQLLIDKGGDALRSALHAVHPPPTLAVALNANKRILQKIRYSVINATQWDLLFPGTGSPDSNYFDITLLTILLRNICGLTSPATGWNVMPPASDTSISADILRIKLFRNEVYGHIPRAQYDDTAFETLWQDISQPLVKLGIPQQHIDELKEAPLSPKEEFYIERLKEWKELEDNLMVKIDDVDEKVENLTEELVKLREALSNAAISKINQLANFNFTGKIEELCKKFQVGTRKWFFYRLSRWFPDDKSRVMILTAGPGIGKSVLAAKVCELYKKCGQLAACHFCNFRFSDYRNPYKILESLASQMCDNVKGFSAKLDKILIRNHSKSSLADVFRVLLNDPLHAIDRREPMLIVLDALDESKTDEKSEFLELISESFPQLPKWIKILITSRPELQVREKLRDLSPLEIHPDDIEHNDDIEYFIQLSLPNDDEDSDIVSSFMLECEGSFLYAYYLVNELKEMFDMGIEPNLSKFAPKGISGFYEKQFKRLRTGLQLFEIGNFEIFVNVVAASEASLPMKILLKCMDVSDKKYEIRDSIINIMSEILPIYDDCLTIYHQSLLDWLTLKGYKDHAFVADVADGNKRIWEACKSMYGEIDVFMQLASQVQIAPDIKFALVNGAEYLVNVGDTDDFHWLVNVDLNFLKLVFFDDLNVDLCHILASYKSNLPGSLYWRILQTHAIMRVSRKDSDISVMFDEGKLSRHIYLHSLANEQYNFTKNTNGDQTAAKEILRKKSVVWIEEVKTGENSEFEIISNAVIDGIYAIASSPNKELLACSDSRTIKVLLLPSLTMIFDLEIRYRDHSDNHFLVFSPDSSYFLCNSIRSCVKIKEQEEVPFIQNGPETIYSCSFSSCGMKLATSEENFIKVWDLGTKELLVEVGHQFDDCLGLFSKCDMYILGIHNWIHDKSKLGVWDSTSLKQLDSKHICVDACFTSQDNVQMISKSNHLGNHNDNFGTGHFHLPSGDIVLTKDNNCSEPFTWRDKKCVAFIASLSDPLSLVVVDIISQEIVDMFHINSLPSGASVDYILNLNETNFLIVLNSSLLFLLSFEREESSVAPFSGSSEIECSALSPDNMYVACFYKNCLLAIRSVDNRDILQTVKLKHLPKACWWSELYLWVVCKSAVVKFPYNSTHKKVVGDGVEECNLDFDGVLGFAAGVLVIRINGFREISILKICKETLCPQEIPDTSIAVWSVAISSDGCAVLLYRAPSSDYKLWEKTGENRWELTLSGEIESEFEIDWICLTGTLNSRRCNWLVHYESPWISDDLRLFSTGLLNVEQYLNRLHIGSFTSLSGVVFLAPDFLLVHHGAWIHFLRISGGDIIATVYLGRVHEYMDTSMFFLRSRGVLLLVTKNDIKYLKIHNIENNFMN